MSRSNDELPNLWRRFRSLPTWVQAVAWIIVIGVLFGTAVTTETGATPTPTPTPTAADHV